MTKKRLIDLMLENNVRWPEGAEFAAQDKASNFVHFYCEKPSPSSGTDRWKSEIGFISGIKLPELCHNWHCTIVTREQYDAAQVRRNSANRAREIITHSISEVVEQINSASRVEVDSSARTLDAVIAKIKECDDKINHHRAELATYTEGRAKFVHELNDMFAKVGMEVVDVGREPAAENGEWPEYCDENGIITDWDKVPEGSEVECVHSESSWFDVDDVVQVEIDCFGDKGPFSIDRGLSSYSGVRNGTYKFRLVK